MEYTLPKEGSMPKQQKTYAKEFKLEAVQLVKSSGKLMSQIARELGISDSALYHWSKQLADQGEHRSLFGDEKRGTQRRSAPAIWRRRRSRVRAGRLYRVFQPCLSPGYCTQVAVIKARTIRDSIG
jgi:transposase-like protein